jgi:hypothetical protein
MCVRYDSKKLEREHFLFNIPDLEFDEIADLISDDLLLAGVGTRPFILISYSMGGVLTRHMILRGMEKVKTNLKGVAFIASPLHGSTLRS